MKENGLSEVLPVLAPTFPFLLSQKSSDVVASFVALADSWPKVTFYTYKSYPCFLRFEKLAKSFVAP